MPESPSTKSHNNLIFKILYGLFYSIFYGISLLPFWVLYRVSELFFLVFRYVIRYRLAVITTNLQNAFPDKSEKEIRQIRQAFYLHFCDLFLETIKLLSISDRHLNRRMKCLNPEVYDQMRSRDIGNVVLASHFGNFEWSNAGMDIDLVDIQGYSIYQKLKNPYFEKLMKAIRSKRGTQMVEKNDAFRFVIRNSKKLGAFGFMADQSPSRRKQLYFSQFLSQPTAMHEGASILAIGRNLPVYYLDVSRVRRGHYTYELKPIDISAFIPEKDIHGMTDLYAQILEKTIRRNPPFWLWSHKRWKHSPQEGDEGTVLL